MIRDWTLDEHRRLRAEAPRAGLRAAHRGGTLQDVAQQVGLDWFHVHVPHHEDCCTHVPHHGQLLREQVTEYCYMPRMGQYCC